MRTVIIEFAPHKGTKSEESGAAFSTWEKGTGEGGEGEEGRAGTSMKRSVHHYQEPVA